MVSIHRPLGYGPSTLPLRHSACTQLPSHSSALEYVASRLWVMQLALNLYPQIVVFMLGLIWAMSMFAIKGLRPLSFHYPKAIVLIPKPNPLTKL